MIKRIAIYCGSAVGNDPVYTEQAKLMAQLLFHKGIGIVLNLKRGELNDFQNLTEDISNKGH